MLKIVFPLSVVLFASIAIAPEPPCVDEFHRLIVDSLNFITSVKNAIVSMTGRGIYDFTFMESTFWKLPQKKFIHGMPNIEFNQASNVYQLKLDPAYEISDTDCRMFLFEFDDNSILKCGGFLMHLMIADRNTGMKISNDLEKVFVNEKRVLDNSMAENEVQINEETCKRKISKLGILVQSYARFVSKIWQRLERKRREHVKELQYCLIAPHYDNITFFDRWKHACSFYTEGED